MILHGYFRSSAAFRVRIALNLKKLSFESVPHHLRKGEQRAQDYLALNPQGLVPTLIDGDVRLVQSLAILEYLDAKHPEPRLLPANAADAAHVRALAQIVACDIHPIDNLRVLNYLRTNLTLDETRVKAWYNHWIALGFEALEATLASDSRTGKFCFGDTPGLADVCLVPQAFNARTFDLDMSPYPTLQRIVAACMALPAFVNAQPDRQPDAD